MSNAFNSESALKKCCLEFSYKSLCHATNEFDETYLLGEGSYGTVYRGIMPNGTEVAIKVLENPAESGFFDEVMTLSRFRHPNLVTLLGFANGPGGVRYLIFEYLSGGDLSQCLHSMGWRMRLSVLLDIAQGLSFLHTQRPVCLHRDIKTANILLSSTGQAKLADFGLARLAHTKHLHFQTATGTMGYADPDYVETGIFSERHELYSFVMVALELLTGLPPATEQGGGFSLTWEGKTLEEVLGLVDPSAGFPEDVSVPVAELLLLVLRDRPRFVEVLGQLRELYVDSGAGAKVRFRPQALTINIERWQRSVTGLSDFSLRSRRSAIQSQWPSFDLEDAPKGSYLVRPGNLLDFEDKELPMEDLRTAPSTMDLLA